MCNLKHQTGDFLIEAMVGTLITALVSLGTLAITTRVMVTQEEMVRQETVVTSLRERLYNPAAKCAAKGENPVVVKAPIKLSDRNAEISEVCSRHTETYRFNDKNYEVDLQITASAVLAADGKAVDYAVGLQAPARANSP